MITIRCRRTPGKVDRSTEFYWAAYLTEWLEELTEALTLKGRTGQPGGSLETSLDSRLSSLSMLSVGTLARQQSGQAALGVRSRV